MVKPHISISEELKDRLDTYCKENNFQCFSHGVIDLLEKGLSQNKIDKVLEIIKEVEKKFQNNKVTTSFERYPRNFG